MDLQEVGCGHVDYVCTSIKLPCSIKLAFHFISRDLLSVFCSLQSPRAELNTFIDSLFSGCRPAVCPATALNEVAVPLLCQIDCRDIFLTKRRLGGVASEHLESRELVYVC